MKMRNFITCFFTTTVMLIFLQHHLVASLSPIKQKTALFQFKQSLSITTPTDCVYYSYDYNYYEIPSHPKTMNWSMSSDYCTWEGVTCEHKTGDVIGLDLSCSQLEGAIYPNNTLFQLSHLQFLNLSHNDFSLSNQFPQEFGFFAKGLTHLNLSGYTGFSGRVPSGISRLYKLVSLDLNGISGFGGTQLEDEVFKSLLQNLTQLRVLNLAFVNISSVLPQNFSTSLRVLNLRYTGLHGVVPQEVFHLPNLEVLALSYNKNLTATLPLNFSTSLRVLNLRYTNSLHGEVPQEVFHLPNLEVLALSSYYGDNNLTATLPKVKWGSSATLQHLHLEGINIYGGIPDSIRFLESLGRLKLYGCNLSGPIPRSIGHLHQLTSLGLSVNNLNGPIPTDLANLTNLIFLRLSYNNFTGPFPSVPHLRELNTLDLSDNSLTGPIPPSLFDLPSLHVLFLRDNGFTGQLYEFDSSKSQLQSFSCSNNQLNGPIPQSFSRLVNLTYLNFSSNRLTGGLEQLPWNNIVYLDLHSNMLNGPLPTLLCNSSSLEVLNLSHNNISGVLPDCSKSLTSITVFDLRMNNIQGNIPATLSNFRSLETINLHGNKLEGRIPSSFAEFDYLQVLDLGSNHINDTFPQCLEGLPNLQVLVLKSNKFHGIINKSSKVEHPFPSLRIIDLSYNEFSGPLPAIYFRNFKAMMNGEVNKIQRSYMERRYYSASSNLVYYSDSASLVIKGIDIVLERILTVFTTIDVSRNNFEGEIAEYIGNLVSLRFLNLSHNHLTGHIPPSIGKLTVLESLDLSSNQLGGEIPQQLTGIYSLALLNLSCNQLRGHIPQGSQFNTFENDSYVGNLGLCGNPLSKKCENYFGTQEEEEDEDDDDYFFSGFTWEAVVIGYGCGVVPAFIIGYLMLLARKPKWFVGIIARELGLKIRRMEIKWR